MTSTAKCKNCGSFNIDTITLTASDRIEPTEEPKTCEDYDDDDADIELISSDNFRFKVHSYRLQSASSVFREMISMTSSSSQRDPIVLTGEYIDCSRVVYRALNIIYYVGVDDFEDWDTNTWSFVIDFAKKWDISMIRSLIVQELRYIALQPDKYKNVAWDLLVLSLKLGKSFLASQFFEWKDESNWSDAVYRSDGISLGDGWTEKVPFSAVVDRKDPSGLPDFQESCQGGAFDLGAGSYPHFLRLPPTVVWIILRAQHLATQGDQPPASETFKRLLVQAYPESLR